MDRTSSFMTGKTSIIDRPGVWDVIVKEDVEQFNKEQVIKRLEKKQQQLELRKFYDEQQRLRILRDMSEKLEDISYRKLILEETD
jgi:hypothetical protein